MNATYYLGMKVGFPLTQTCIVVTALWGVLFFREMDLGQPRVAVRLGVGVAAIVAGSYLLAASSEG